MGRPLQTSVLSGCSATKPPRRLAAETCGNSPRNIGKTAVAHCPRERRAGRPDPPVGRARSGCPATWTAGAPTSIRTTSSSSTARSAPSASLRLSEGAGGPSDCRLLSTPLSLTTPAPVATGQAENLDPPVAAEAGQATTSDHLKPHRWCARRRAFTHARLATGRGNSAKNDECERGARHVAGSGTRDRGRSLVRAASPHLSLAAASALTRWTNV